MILLVFHSDKSGNEINDEQPKKIPLLYITLFVFHLDKSGKDIREEQP